MVERGIAYNNLHMIFRRNLVFFSLFFLISENKFAYIIKMLYFRR